MHVDPQRLLAEIQLAFVIFLYVQNFAGLLAYKRLLSLCARCEELFHDLDDISPAEGVTLTRESVGQFYSLLVRTLEAHIKVVPETFLTAELAGTGMEDFWFAEIKTLIRTYGSNVRRGDVELDGAIGTLRETVRTKFGWDLPDLGTVRRQAVEDENENADELEEGEDAPVVVEL
jgi:A1 cistron-splicing factor AAR2